MTAVQEDRDLDYIGLWLEERITKSHGARPSQQDLYKDFLDFTETRGYPSSTQRIFSKSLIRRGYVKCNTSKGMAGFQDIDLKS